MTITVDIDLRDRFCDARDQGLRPTCLVFAVSAAHEARRESPDYLSTEYLFYRGAQRSHQDPTKGLSRDAVREALLHDGQPLEASWPYTHNTPNAATWKPPVLSEPAHTAKIEYAARTVAQICDYLQTGKPLVLVMSLTGAMYSPDGAAVVRQRAGDRTTTARHAVVAVGMGHADDGNYILIRNSWGKRWGESGYGWLHEPYLTSQLQTTGLVA